MEPAAQASRGFSLALDVDCGNCQQEESGYKKEGCPSDLLRILANIGRLITRNGDDPAQGGPKGAQSRGYGCRALR